MGEHVIGWKLASASREALLTALPPRYGEVVADHVTLKTHVDAATPPPPPARCRIIGEADDGEGVQAMVVEIDGDSDRPDGGTFHITWSLAQGRDAVESNAVIAARGWTALEPREVALVPARFP